jgi:hypothetical protein
MQLLILLALVVSSLARSFVKGPPARDARTSSNKYIVKVKGDVHTSAEAQLKASLSAAPDHHYSLHGFRGFAGTLTTEELTRLESDNLVCWLSNPIANYGC